MRFVLALIALLTRATMLADEAGPAETEVGVEAVFGIALSQALDQGEDFSAAVAALNLLGIYDQEGRAADHEALAPTIGALTEAPGLSGATRAALASLYAALRDQTGSIGLLLLRAVAALDREAQSAGEPPAPPGGSDPNER